MVQIKIDFNLVGFGFVNLSKFRLRRPVPASHPRLGLSHWCSAMPIGVCYEAEDGAAITLSTRLFVTQTVRPEEINNSSTKLSRFTCASWLPSFRPDKSSGFIKGPCWMLWCRCDLDADALCEDILNRHDLCKDTSSAIERLTLEAGRQSDRCAFYTHADCPCILAYMKAVNLH